MEEKCVNFLNVFFLVRRGVSSVSIVNSLVVENLFSISAKNKGNFLLKHIRSAYWLSCLAYVYVNSTISRGRLQSAQWIQLMNILYLYLASLLHLKESGNFIISFVVLERLDAPGLVSRQRHEIFLHQNCPDRLWGPPNFLFQVTRALFRG